MAKLRSVVPLLSAELASKSYVRYVTERLEICLMNVWFLKERIYSLRDGAEQLDADEREVVETYADDIHELLVCLEEMYEEWRDNADSMQTGLSRPRLHSDEGQGGYQTPLSRSSRPQRGRPRFDIGQDQLQYLSGMGFSWADTARLLGVSRMTVYRRCQPTSYHLYQTSNWNGNWLK